MNILEAQNALMAILFSATEVVNEKKLASIIDCDIDITKLALKTLQDRLDGEEGGLVLKQIAGGWRLFTSPKYCDMVKEYVTSLDSRKLSQAAIETLAIIAYSQPVTRANIAAVRGVNADSSVNGLIEKGLIREAGHADAPGNPVLYATTTLFLEHFGLNSIKDLPDISQFAPDEETKSLIEESLSAAHIEVEADNNLSEDVLHNSLAGKDILPADTDISDKGMSNGQNSSDNIEDSDEQEYSKKVKESNGQASSEITSSLNDKDGSGELKDSNEQLSSEKPKDSRQLFESTLQSAFGTTEKIDFDKLVLDKDDE